MFELWLFCMQGAEMQVELHVQGALLSFTAEWKLGEVFLSEVQGN